MAPALLYKDQSLLPLLHRSHTSSATMALRLPPIHSIIQLLQPAVARQPFLTSPFLRRIPIPSIPARALAIPITAFAGVSDFLREIWEGILKAVPKKKTSHMKKRHRQMAGKALKDVTALNKCSACGKVKQAHTLCPYCVQGMYLSDLQMNIANWSSKLYGCG